VILSGAFSLNDEIDPRQEVIPFQADAVTPSDRPAWQWVSVQNLALTGMTLAFQAGLAWLVEAAYALFDTPMWIVWPTRIVGIVGFVVPTILAMIGDAWEAGAAALDRIRPRKNV
jgi:hypothetical protein